MCSEQRLRLKARQLAIGGNLAESEADNLGIDFKLQREKPGFDIVRGTVGNLFVMTRDKVVVVIGRGHVGAIDFDFVNDFGIE